MLNHGHGAGDGGRQNGLNRFPSAEPHQKAGGDGLTLAGNALSDAVPNVTEVSGESVLWTVTALVTLLSTVAYSHYLKGFLGQLPLLLGALTGCAVAAAAVIAAIMVIGIGGNYAFGGNIPFFGFQIPCIAGAAVFGILLNLILSLGEKKAQA